MRLQGRAREAFEQLVRKHATASKEELFELFQIVVESDALVRAKALRKEYLMT